MLENWSHVDINLVNLFIGEKRELNILKTIKKDNKRFDRVVDKACKDVKKN